MLGQDNNKSLFYYGGKLTRNGNTYTLDFEEYVKKICPLTVEKGRKPDEKLNDRDVSKVRGMIGALQWPAGQGMPALAASVSVQAGMLATGTVSFLHDLNKTLRFAKKASETKINVKPFGKNLSDLCMVASLMQRLQRDTTTAHRAVL